MWCGGQRRRRYTSLSGTCDAKTVRRCGAMRTRGATWWPCGPEGFPRVTRRQHGGRESGESCVRTRLATVVSQFGLRSGSEAQWLKGCEPDNVLGVGKSRWHRTTLARMSPKAFEPSRRLHFRFYFDHGNDAQTGPTCRPRKSPLSRKERLDESGPTIIHFCSLEQRYGCSLYDSAASEGSVDNAR